MGGQPGRWYPPPPAPLPSPPAWPSHKPLVRRGVARSQCGASGRGGGGRCCWTALSPLFLGSFGDLRRGRCCGKANYRKQLLCSDLPRTISSSIISLPAAESVALTVPSREALATSCERRFYLPDSRSLVLVQLVRADSPNDTYDTNDTFPMWVQARVRARAQARVRGRVCV